MRCAQGDGGGSTRLEPDGGEARGPCVGFDRKFFASSHTLYTLSCVTKSRGHTLLHDRHSVLAVSKLLSGPERRNSTHTAAAPHQNISREPAGLPGHAARIAFHLISDLPRRLEVCKLHLERDRRHALTPLRREADRVGRLPEEKHARVEPRAPSGSRVVACRIAVARPRGAHRRVG